MGISELTSKKKHSTLNDNIKSDVILAVQDNPFSFIVQLVIEN